MRIGRISKITPSPIRIGIGLRREKCYLQMNIAILKERNGLSAFAEGVISQSADGLFQTFFDGYYFLWLVYPRTHRKVSYLTVYHALFVGSVLGGVCTDTNLYGRMVEGITLLVYYGKMGALVSKSWHISVVSISLYSRMFQDSIKGDKTGYKNSQRI